MYPVANPKVIQRAQQILAVDPIFLDTETTGFSPQDVVIEIGVVDLAGQTVYESFIKPSIPIPEKASAIHGIREDMLTNAPSWKQAWEDLRPVLEGRFIGAYNADFDLRMMKQTHEHYGLNWPIDDKNFFCVMQLYALFHGEPSQKKFRTSKSQSKFFPYRFHKLEAAGAACGIPLPNAHRAVDDAKLTAALFHYIANYTA